MVMSVRVTGRVCVMSTYLLTYVRVTEVETDGMHVSRRVLSTGPLYTT